MSETQALSNKKEGREAKARLARMQANTELHEHTLRRRRVDNLVAIAAMAVAVAVACVLALTAFSGSKNDAAASDTPGPTPSASATAAATNSPTVPKVTAADKAVFTGTLTLNGQPMGVQLDGTKAPQATAVFRYLAAKDFFKGKSCHRLTASTGFYLLQCGSLHGDGNGDPSFQWGPVENTPASGDYPAGTIAIARGSSTYSNGTQFFITYKDTKLPQDAGGYTILGKVTSGLDVVSKIADGGITAGASGATDGAPKTKVTIDSFTLK